ncbi:LOG family protein [Nocardia sp. R16R-3T]
MQFRICVLCGSGAGISTIYIEEAVRLAGALAEAGIGLVYGGGGAGLMGVVARSLKSRGGHVTGVVPQVLFSEEEFIDESDLLHVVNSYHERKMLMYYLSDGFIVLPGGPGTLEELMEHLTWMHRGRTPKPVYIINQAGYWDPLLQMFESMQDRGFISHDLNSKYLICESSCDAVSDFMYGPVRSGIARISTDVKGEESISIDQRIAGDPPLASIDKNGMSESEEITQRELPDVADLSAP